MAKKNVDYGSYIGLRMNKEDVIKFKKKAHVTGKSCSSLLREMIKAFNEDRVRIIPTDEQKATLKIYQK